MIIAIDGPAGSGKSTIARMLAKELGYYFLNTGSFYRAYTLAQLEKGLDPLDADSVLENAKKITISVSNGDIHINGVDVEDRLHTPEVDRFWAKRRHEEHPDGPDYQSVLDEINKRDERDRNKAVGALKIADGAIYIDTTYLTIKQVCEKVLEAMNS